MKKKTAVIHYSVIVLIIASFIAANIVASQFSGLITQYLCGFGINYDSEAALEAKREGQAMALEIEEQGIILLKNDNNALPLSDKKINIFGWSACDAGFIYGGGGSSVGSTEDLLSFMCGLKKTGIIYNESLENSYNALGYSRETDMWAANSKYLRMIEPGAAFYTDSLMSQAKDYSDTALIVIGRRGGEGRDLDKWQYSIDGIRDDSRTYAQLTANEELMIEKVTQNFAKVIIILNTANVMELGFLENSKIDAALSVGMPGNSGSEAIGKILLGDITPSGRTVDTYAYDLKTAPSYNNAATDGSKIYTGGGSFTYIDYAEGIYIGYKWYETADAEHYWDNVSNIYGNGYAGVVQYPFGYGLSYADFEWTITDFSIEENALINNEKTEITVKVFVQNVSDKYHGADVVQLYYSPPYAPGGIEKSAIELCAFNKTSVLEPGQGQELELSVELEDMASYDCYDANNNGFMGYELEGGNYTLSLRKDAHMLGDIINGSAVHSFRIPVGGLKYETDAVTGYKVENLFTNYTNTVSGASSKTDDNDPVIKKIYSIDGVDSNQNIKYMSRNNFAETFPQEKETRALNSSMYSNALKNSSPKTNSSDTMPSTSSKNTDYKLENMLELEYGDTKWDDLISQLSVTELGNLCGGGGYKTIEIKSIGKPYCIDIDGPSGLTTSNTGSNGGKATYYPCETVLASTWSWKIAYKFGCAIGVEAEALDVDGWYAPGANLHRSPFGGRNFEYYSEDSYLSGIMAAYEIKGCIDNGLYCYLKHFAVNDSDTGRNGQCRWLTEQTLREVYLKPFDIAVKLGGANAMMSSVDRIGCTRASGSYSLLTTILRNEWGFEGSVISDYYQDFSGQGSTTHDADEFIRAGNDLALDPSGTISIFDDSTSATAVIALQKSAKNILFTYVNTQYIAATTKGLDLSSAIGSKSAVFPWWIPVLISVDIVIAGGCAVWGIIIFRKTKKLEKAVSH